MNRRANTIALVLVSIALAPISTANAGGRGGIAGVVIGIARNHISGSRTPIRDTSSHHHTPSYPVRQTHHTHTPVVQTPSVYSQPTYSSPIHSQPVNTQPVYSQPAVPTSAYSQSSMPRPMETIAPSYPTTSVPSTVQLTSGNTGNQVSTPVNSMPQIPASTANTAGVQPSPSENKDQTEVSALQLLASISGETTTESVAAEIPEFSAVATPIAATMGGDHIGTWTVALPGNQSIMLILNNDNSFAWNATKEGKSSSFEGQYRLEAGRLTLVRSNDLQQMAGSWAGDGTASTFKLDGATTSGLTFTRTE